jgi:hypothetical protein
MSIPKTDPTDNTKKDPDEWVSGDDPMTGAGLVFENPVRAGRDLRAIR